MQNVFFCDIMLVMEEKDFQNQILDALTSQNLFGKNDNFVIQTLSKLFGVKKKTIISVIADLTSQNKIVTQNGKILSVQKDSATKLDVDNFSKFDNIAMVKAGTIKKDGNGKLYVLTIGNMLCKIENSKLARNNIGKLCVVAIKKKEKFGLSGSVEKVIGDSDNLECNELAIAIDNHIQIGFGDDAIKQAKNMPKVLTKKDFEGAEDWRNLPFVAVDPVGCKDRDDAICAEQIGKKFVVRVAITDINHFVPFGSPLWKEAYMRSTSHYSPTFSIPMFPREITQQIFSLDQGKDRRVLAVQIELDKFGRVLSEKFVPAIINVKHSMSYQDFEAIKNGAMPETFLGEKRLTDLCFDIAKKQEENLLANGKLEVGSAQPEYILSDDKRDVVSAKNEDESFSHKVIENFMILANRAAGNFFERNGTLGIFRIHEEMDEMHEKQLKKWLQKFGVDDYFENSSIGVSELAKTIKETPFADILSVEIVKNLMRAQYSTCEDIHFGLGFDEYEPYVHFTSPARRFADVVAHKIILDCLANKKSEISETSLENIVEHINMQEQVASRAERQFDQFAYCHIAQNQMGMGRSYDCQIMSIADGYLVAKDKSSPMTFKVPFEKLSSSVAPFLPDTDNVSISNGAKTFAMGDEICCKVYSIDFSHRTIYAGIKKEKFVSQNSHEKMPEIEKNM